MPLGGGSWAPVANNIAEWPPNTVTPWEWPPIPRPPLPRSVRPIEYWHSSFQCAPSAWIGQLAGLVLAGLGATVVAPDLGFFKGRAVAQSSIAGNAAWVTTFGSPVALAGTFPEIYCVGRNRTLDGVSRFVAGAAGGGITHGVLQRAANQRALWNSAALVVSPGAADTNPHKFATYLNGAQLSLRVDVATYTAAYAPAMLADMFTISVGRDPLLATFTDGSCPFLLLTDGKMTTAEEAAIDQYCNILWGV